MNCSICKQPIHPGRLKALPNTKTCTACSQAKPYGVVSIVNHKTGNEVQIIPNKELADLINIQSQRKGYGVSRGVKGSYKR